MQTGHLARQGGEGIGVRQVGNLAIVELHTGDGTRHILTLGGTITYHNHLVQHLGIVLQSHSDVGTGLDGLFLEAYT